MRLAVDLDGTLADIHTPAVARSDRIDAYRPETFSQEDWDDYYHRSMNVWHNHSDEVPLVEECVPVVMDSLQSQFHLTILTHRCNVDEQINDWLEAHDIPHDDFVATRDDKGTFDMDAYIDDNPIEAEGATVLLRSQPWNESATEHHDHRIDSLRQAVDILR